MLNNRGLQIASNIIDLAIEPKTSIDPRIKLLSAVVLNRILQFPLDRVTLLDQFGKVALVHFVPCEDPDEGEEGELDPVVPVILGRMGDKFNTLMKVYYTTMMQWRSDFNEAANRSWGSRMAETVSVVIRFSHIYEDRGVGNLDAEEWDYFRMSLEACAVFPGTGEKLVEAGL